MLYGVGVLPALRYTSNRLLPSLDSTRRFSTGRVLCCAACCASKGYEFPIERYSAVVLVAVGGTSP